MSVDPLVQPVEDELLALANQAHDWESVMWLASVGRCFDGGDFDTEDFGNLHWRLDVLRHRIGHRRTDTLIGLCQAVLDGDRAKERNNTPHCGNLRSATAPLALPAQ